jgi:hypothetical protein
MIRRISGFKSWWLLAIVAVVAVSLAATRVESAPGAGIAIVGSSIGYLAYKAFLKALALRRARAMETSRSRRAGLFLLSTLKAVVIIGLSDAMFLAGFYGYMKVVNQVVLRSHWRSNLDPGCLRTATALGLFLALYTASRLGSAIWPEMGATSKTSRRWLTIVSGLPLVVLGSLEMLRFPDLWIALGPAILFGLTILGFDLARSDELRNPRR